VKYGVTTDYVLGLQVVLADGTAVQLGGPRLKDVAGLSLTKLFVGSEGSLGVITEVTLRLLPPQQVMAGGSARAGGDGAQPPDQTGARPGRHPQTQRGDLVRPRRDVTVGGSIRLWLLTHHGCLSYA
jgi:hypothetical protein